MTRHRHPHRRAPSRSAHQTLLGSAAILTIAATAPADHTQPFSVSGPASALVQYDATLGGTLREINVTCEFDNQGNFVFASDLILGIVAPNGNAIEFGGGGLSLTGTDGITFTDAGEFPGTWRSENSNEYTLNSVALNAFGLSGEGTWHFYFMNAWAPSPGAGWSGTVTYEGPSVTSATFTGPGTQWGSPSNWQDGVIARPGLDAIFGNPNGGGRDVLLGTDRRVDGVRLTEFSAFRFDQGTLRLDEGWIDMPSGGLLWFDDTLEPLAPALWTTSQTSSRILIDGELLGAQPIRKTGPGTLEFETPTSYTGALTIDAGTLDLDHADALANATLVWDGGTLAMDRDAEIATIHTNAPISTGNHELTIGANDAASTIDSTFSGQLRKTGSGDLTVTGNTAGSARIEVDAGTLVVASTAGLAQTTVNLNGGDLQFDVDPQIGAVNTALDLDLGSTGLVIGTNGQSSVITGLFKGTGPLTKIGSGTLDLSTEVPAGNQYRGAISVLEGTIRLGRRRVGINDYHVGGTLEFVSPSFPSTNQISGGGRIIADDLSINGGDTLFTGTMDIANELLANIGTTRLGGIVNTTVLSLDASIQLENAVINTTTSNSTGAGAIIGHGRINGTSDHWDGYWDPGTDAAPIGTLEFQRAQTVGGEIYIDLFGTTAGVSHDQLLVDETMHIRPQTTELHITYGDSGFVAQPGDTFEIMVSGDTRTGTFSQVVFPDSQKWVVDYHDLGVRLTVSCPCDTDANGTTDVQDLLAFLTDWFGADADYNNDGLTDVVDLLAYVSCWFPANDNAGCE